MFNVKAIMKYYIRIIIVMLVFFAGLNKASSQSVIEDSLKSMLRRPNLSTEMKVMALSQLGRNT